MPRFFSMQSALGLCLGAALLGPGGMRAQEAGIPIRFSLKEQGFVTLAIDDAQGVRIRNLISETEFPAGEHTVSWDGLDDSGRDLGAAKYGRYHVPGKVVAPGQYTVRGLVRPKIGLTYGMAPYTHGRPAWFTADRSSGWLTNHSAPQAILFVPAGQAPEREGKPSSRNGQVLVGSHVSEGGSGLAWLDMDGNKVHGQEWIGGNWTAASHLARDRGKNPVPGVYAYAAATFAGGDTEPELRLNEMLTPSQWGEKPKAARLGTGEDRPVLSPHYKIADFPAEAKSTHQSDILGGVAVHDGLLVASLQPLNELIFVDAHARKALGKAALDDPRGLEFDAQGRLWVLSGKRLLRLTPGADPTRLPTPEVIVAEGLEDPRLLTFDGEGNVCISDWGASHQVKIFSPQGRFLRAVGKPGAPTVGPYDPLHMNHPAGVAVDDRGRLWVAENDFSPKRVSVWAKDGTLENAFYGPARYGGGGALDPRDKTVFYYGEEQGGMQFRLDWASGQSQLESVYYRKEADPVPLHRHFTGNAPETPFPVAGRTYLTNAYNSDPVAGAGLAEIWVLENGVARKVAAAGDARGPSGWLPAFDTAGFADKLPRDADFTQSAIFFLWADEDGDGRMQPGEVAFRQTQGKRWRVGGVTVEKDLSFVVARLGSEAVRFKPGSFTEKGVPLYDAAHGEVLAQNVTAPVSTGGGQALTGEGGWTVFTTAPEPFSPYGFAGFREGRPLWTYPNLWPGLHASHNAAMPSFPGELLGPTRLAGPPIHPAKSDAGELWAINGNKGVIYLFTFDGLFVATLFRDSRTASWSAPEAVPGMPVDQYSLMEECFWPAIMQLDNGEIFLQAGTNDGPIRLIRVTGLEGIRRLPDTKITVTEETLRMAAAAAKRAEAERQERRLPRKIRVPLLQEPPTVDGQPTEWQRANWAPIDTRRLQVGDWGGREIPTRAALAVAGDRLYGIFQTDDPNLLTNAGTSLSTLFKTGGGLDVLIGAAGADPRRTAAVAGDVRLLISMVHDEPVAMLYRPATDKGAGEPVEYTSPVRTVRISRVESLGADLELARAVENDEKGHLLRVNYEFSVPLARLGIVPGSGQAVRGDLGVLRGDGRRTMQRVYWNNKSTGLVSDTPSEAELTPALWGTLRFEAAP